MPQTLAPPASPAPEREPQMTFSSSAAIEAELAGIAVEPVVEQVSEQPRDTSPVQFMGGTFYDQEKNGNSLSYIQSTGRQTLPPLPSRHTKGMPWRTRIHTGQADEVVLAPKALLRTADEGVTAITSLAQEARADELLATLEGQPERITLIGQSADAQPALIAVHKKPDKFKNLILAFPSGVPKKQKRSEFTRQAASRIAEGRDRIPKAVIEPENDFDTPLPDSPRELAKTMMRRFKGSGGLRALASTMSGYQGGLLHELRQNEDSPGVSMVLGTRDPAFPADRIINGLKSANDVDFLLIVNSTHGIQGRKNLMDRVLELTDMMEARTQARQAAKERGEEFEAESLADRLIFLEDEAYRIPDEEQDKLRELARNVPH